MAHQIKHWGLSITISLEGCTHRLVDVGNRIHTRNDSDEDVRGYVCKQAIAWKALPWSFIIRQNNRIKTILKELNIEVKPSRLLSACIPFRGLRYACPRLPTSASRCVLPSRQVFAISNVYRVSPSLGCPLVLSGEQFLCYYSKSPANAKAKCSNLAILCFCICRAKIYLCFTAEALFLDLDSSVLNIQSIVWRSHSLTCDIEDCIVGRS